jgi:hypothetical protein
MGASSRSLVLGLNTQRCPLTLWTFCWRALALGLLRQLRGQPGTERTLLSHRLSSTRMPTTRPQAQLPPHGPQILGGAANAGGTGAHVCPTWASW